MKTLKDIKCDKCGKKMEHKYCVEDKKIICHKCFKKLYISKK